MDTLKSQDIDLTSEVGADEPEKVGSTAVAAKAAAELRRQLTEGLLKPGERLSEPGLTKSLGVSRNTLREAFAELSAERLVVRIPSRGVFVASPGPGDLRDFYVVRRTVEVSTVRNGGSAERIAVVCRAVEDGRAAAESGDLNALATANQRFHGAIVEMAESDRLNSLMQQVLAEMRLFFHKESVDVAFYTRYLQDNEVIAEALSAGDFRGASDMLLEYLRRSEDHLMSIYLYGEGRRD
ncbi:GntR family transcriptional regulator [Arthrobacter nitrophenolicus]|uniref:GntR family transcriptional regulator n=1 Tax=Arthrobacter nitrophenolicus TaxID=683150 RepID=A0A4R5Y591_9MICC|nr:GntR family transcriptional regulator [Arthrobacter nitrophenolicus]TDL39663.1 GntR family transcriptional regulator [Arthrobacter nitrophenolicus]